jgi:predicted  nucleic acid-binding Zn-ribbon protein
MSEDACIVVSVDDIKAFERLKLISQIAPVKERIRSFESKHRSNLDAFEERLKHLPEDFERWDDFIEWKAYRDSLKDLESRLKKIEDATNFRIASG